uniref:Uncharacterized protein n=1 Tax=Strongyloides papillosus TaxID=174720 RepID=A0A0N5BHW8_STREA
MKEEDCYSDSTNPSSNVERKRIVAPRTSDEEALFLAQKYYDHWPLLEAKLAYNIEDGRNKRLLLLEKIAEDLSTKFGVAIRDRRYCEQKLRDMKKEARRSLYANSQQQRKFSNQFSLNEKYTLNNSEGLRKEPNKAIKLIIEALQSKDLFKESSEGKNTLNSCKRLDDKSFGVTAGDEDIHSDEMEFLEEDTNSNINYKEKIIPEDIQLPLFSQATPTFQHQISNNFPTIDSTSTSNRMENHGNSFKILSAPFSMLPVSLFSPPDNNNINKNDTSPVLFENIAANLLQLQNNVVLGNVLGISEENGQHKNGNDKKIQKDFGCVLGNNRVDKGRKERKVRGSNQVWRCVKKFDTTDEYENWLSGEISHWYRNKRIQLTNGYQHLFYCRYSQKAGYQQCRSQMRANYNKETMQISVEVNDKPHLHELLKDENNPKKGTGNESNFNKIQSIYNSSLPIPIVTTSSSSLPSTPNSVQGLLSINLGDVNDNTSNMLLTNDSNNNINSNTTTTSSISNASAFTGDGTRSHLSTPNSNNNGSDFTKENQEKKRILKRKYLSGYRNPLVNRLFITEEIEKNREIKKFYQELNSQLGTVTEAVLNFLSLGCQFFESHLGKDQTLEENNGSIIQKKIFNNSQ